MNYIQKKILQTLSILAVCLFFSINLFSQELINDCPSDRIHKELLEEDWDYAQKYKAFEKLYRQRIENLASGVHSRNSSVVYTLPVVVHIIHSGEALGTTENPSDASIISSINTSSQRFRHTQGGANVYTAPLDAFYGADTEIDLCLAHEDPNGNYTSGIVRYFDPVNTLDPPSSFLNSIEWDTDKYINIFIATDIGGPCGYYTSGGNDYTVYLASCYNTGLVAHELGHYFSLSHTFTANGSCTNNDCLSDGDGVCDTPPKLNSGFTGTPCAASGNECTTDEDDTSTNNPYRPVAMGGLGDQNDHLENYMDYTGSCWDCFTEGQKVRMRTYIDANRVDLKNNSSVCSFTTAVINDVGVFHVYVTQVDPCDTSPNLAFTLNNYGSNSLTSVDIEVAVNGAVQYTETWTGSLASGASESFLLATAPTLPAGTSSINVRTVSPNGLSDTNTSNDMISASAETFGINLTCTSISSCSTINAATASGPGNTSIINISGAFPTSSVSKVEICVTFEGDTSYSGELFTIYDEGNVNRGTTQFGSDCSGPSPPACFIAGLSDYAAWIADGSITITCDPVSSQINPDLCATNDVCANITVGTSSCSPDITLTGAILSDTYTTMNYIICSGTISSPETVTLRTNDSIEFPAGFELIHGAELDADTQGSGCN